MRQEGLTHYSLFSGIGGLDLAAEMAGFRTVGQVEIDDYCNRILEYHWPDVPRWRDVKDVTKESFEARTRLTSLALLSGGFPCQPVSAAGKRKGDADERWLWDEMLRVICEIRPRWVVAENVRGLLSIKSNADGRSLFGRVLRDLAQNGYRAGWLCFGAGDVGAPHRRERVFIMAYAEELRSRGGADQQCPIRWQELVQGEQAGGSMGDQVEGRCGGSRKELAYPKGGQSRQQETGNGREDFSRGSEEMADPERNRLQRGKHQGIEQGQANLRRRSANESGTNMAYTPRHLLNRAGEARLARGREYSNGCVGNANGLNECAIRQFWRWQGVEPGRVCKTKGKTGATEPRLGNSPDGLPCGLAGDRWPAGWWPTPRANEIDCSRTSIGTKGMNRIAPDGREWGSNLTTATKMWPAGPGEQYPWEPPRIATGVKDRVAKLKALGNAVVPAQAYPVFRAIAEAEGELL